jgi:diguanylate cyclase (GGDEF)-like protein
VDLARLAQDPSTQSYSEFGVAWALLQLKRPAEALSHAQEARRLLPDGDPRQARRIAELQAAALVDLGRPNEAANLLLRVRHDAFASTDELEHADWLRAAARSSAGQGRWEEAYGHLDQWSALQSRLLTQQLSRQTMSMRMRFQRDQDAAALQALQNAHDQEKKTIAAQQLAILLSIAVSLVSAALWYQKRRHAGRLHQLAMHDELTGLMNRRAVMSCVNEEASSSLRTSTPLAVLIVDVDYFKRINDAHGHGVGDEVLRELANRLRSAVRQGDHVGRLGGEEFGVVLPRSTIDAALRIADRMRLHIGQQPFATSAGPLKVTVSIGLAGNDARLPMNEVVLAADRALYHAKHAGRDQVQVAKTCEPAA